MVDQRTVVTRNDRSWARVNLGIILAVIEQRLGTTDSSGHGLAVEQRTITKFQVLKCSSELKSDEHFA